MTFPEFFAYLMRLFLRIHGSLALVMMYMQNHVGNLRWYTASDP